MKANGWNGSLNMVCPNVEQSTPVAVESMLDAIGIKLNVTDNAPLTTTELQVIVDKNFDLACWGYNVIDDQPFPNLWLQFSSTSPNNFAGYPTRRWTRPWPTWQGRHPAEQKAATTTIASLFATTYPSVNAGTSTVPDHLQVEREGPDQHGGGHHLFDHASIVTAPGGR